MMVNLRNVIDGLYQNLKPEDEHMICPNQLTK